MPLKVKIIPPCWRRCLQTAAIKRTRQLQVRLMYFHIQYCLNITLSSQVCCLRKMHCSLQVFSHSGFVISCQHLELDDVIGSYAALNSLKLTVWELDLRRVLQRDWKRNINFTAAFELSKPPPTCVQAAEKRMTAEPFFSNSQIPSRWVTGHSVAQLFIYQWQMGRLQSVWYITCFWIWISSGHHWTCPEETSAEPNKQYWH